MDVEVAGRPISTQEEALVWSPVAMLMDSLFLEATFLALKVHQTPLGASPNYRCLPQAQEDLRGLR